MSGSDDTPMNLAWIRRHVATHWQAWGLGGAAPSALHVLQVAGGNWHVGQRRMVWLVFADRGEEPVLACKCAPGGESGPLANEYRALQALAAASRPLGFAVPAPVEFRTGPRGTLLVQRCLRGYPLHAPRALAGLGSALRRARRSLELAGDLCCALVSFASGRSFVPAAGHPALTRTRARLADLRQVVSARLWAGVDLERLEAVLAGCRLPQPWYSHGDVTSDHLILGPAGWGVIDWEGFSEDGLPFSDLVHYLFTMPQYFPPVRKDIVADALLERSPEPTAPVSTSIRQAVDRVAAASGCEITASQKQFLLALAVLDVAVTDDWQAVFGGARQAEWGGVVERALRVLGVGPN